MAVTFTKLFSSITASTIWLEDDQTRIVWITLLAMANKNGCVFASVPGLAKMAGVPVESTRKALAKFQAPDPDSRSKEHEGRRLEEIDGGWRLLTYAKHRSIRDEEERREYLKEYMRDYRKQKALTKRNDVNHSEPSLTQAEAEAEAEADKGQAPPDQPPLNYAVKLIDDLEMCDSMANRMVIEAAVKAQIKAGKSGPSAYQFLLGHAKDAIDRGDIIDKFWFEDSKWKRGGTRASKREQAFEEARRRSRETD